jgi:dihydrolipoamide dehydrogenase
MQNRKNTIVKQLTGGVKTLLKQNGVEVYIGQGTVIDKNTLEVNGETLQTKSLIIATGSSSVIPNIPGIRESMEGGFAVTSKGLLAIKEVPKELIVIGGGVIGIEFAVLFNALGSHVTILQRSGMILRGVDEEIRTTMEKILLKKGIDIIYEVNFEKFDKDHLTVKIKEEIKTLRGDAILLSLGRKANIEGLEKLNLTLEKNSIKTNEKLQTNIEGVYAIGDVNGKFMLAHVASAEGIVAVENILGESSKIDYDKIPSCIYSFPEIGVAGLTEEEALARGHEVIVSKFPLSANGKALAEGETEGFIKIVADKKYGEILGVHILASHATDMISEAVTTMQLEGTVHDVAKAIHPHPTLSEAIMEAAHGAIDKPIHIFKG